MNDLFTQLAGMLAGDIMAITFSVSGNADALTVVVNRFGGNATPALQLTGTPAELDAQFGHLLGNYQEAATSLDEQLAAIKAAINAAKEVARKDAEEKAQSRKPAKALPPPVCDEDGEGCGASGTGGEVMTSDSLFD